MKKILFLSFICFSLVSFAQQKPKSKTNVSIIKENPKTNVPILTDADADLLPITSNEPQETDLLDVVSSQTPAIKSPNAGTAVFEQLGLQSTFAFNKKIGFMATSSDGDMVGHFFFNTKNGYSLLPHEALSDMVKSDGKIDQIMSPFSEFFQYTKSSEGNYAMKMSSNASSEANHDWMSASLSKKFFSTFKKTGKTRKIGGQNQFKSVEYNGKDNDGKDIYIYLSAANDVLIDTKKTHSLTGHWGLGYVASPSKRTYMITGIMGSGVSIFMTYNQNASHTFSGKNYKPMGDVMGEAMKGKMPDMEIVNKEMMEQINAEEDPKLKQLMLEQMNQIKKLNSKTQSQAEKFAQSSDIKDLPYVSDVNDPKATADFYDMQIIAREQTIREVELSLAEAQKGNDSKVINRLICTKNCYTTELNRLQKVKAEHIKILNQYKNDDEKRDERLNQLMETQGIPKACACE